MDKEDEETMEIGARPRADRPGNQNGKGPNDVISSSDIRDPHQHDQKRLPTYIKMSNYGWAPHNG